MKKIIAFVLCSLLCLSVLAACSNDGDNDAVNTPVADEDAVVNALKAELDMLKSGELSDGSFVSEAPFANEDPATYKALFAKFAYTVDDVNFKDESNADVEVSITMADLGAALGKYMQALNEHAGEEDWDADFSVFYDILSGDDAEVTTNEVVVAMTKTEDGWKIADDNAAFVNAISGNIGGSNLLG